jgi:hypothetical protein
MVSCPGITYGCHVHKWSVDISQKGLEFISPVWRKGKRACHILFSVHYNVSTDKRESWLPSKRSAGLSQQA